MAFKNMSWTRVIALSEFEDGATRVFKMTDDVLRCKQDIAEIELSDLSMLLIYFDPVRWQA